MFEALLVFGCAFLVAGVLVAAFFIMYRQSRPRRVTFNDIVEMEDVRIEVDRGHLPHVGTYTHVLFSKDGAYEADCIEDMVLAIEDNAHQQPRTIGLLCRMCMVANEMNVDTGATGNLKWPTGMYDMGELIGKAIDRTEVFGRCMVVQNEHVGNIPIFVLRGTSSREDWYTDAKIPRVSLAEVLCDPKLKGTAHKGFVDVYRSMCVGVFEKLNRIVVMRGGVRYVVVTGHSLGAALATLMAYHIHHWCGGDIQVVLITFGSPRVGNEEFAVSFQKTGIYSLRMANEHDTVTEIPPDIYGFRHVKFKLPADVAPREVGLPDDYSFHNLYNYLYSLEPDARDIVCAIEYLRIKK